MHARTPVVVAVSVLVSGACNPLAGFRHGGVSLSSVVDDPAGPAPTHDLSVVLIGEQGSGEGVSEATLRIDDGAPAELSASWSGASPNDVVGYLLGQKTPLIEGVVPVVEGEPRGGEVVIEGDGGELRFTIPDLRTSRVPVVVSGEQRDGALVAGGAIVLRWPADTDVLGDVTVVTEGGDEEVALDVALDTSTREIAFVLPAGNAQAIRVVAHYALALEGLEANDGCAVDELGVCSSQAVARLPVIGG